MSAACSAACRSYDKPEPPQSAACSGIPRIVLTAFVLGTKEVAGNNIAFTVTWVGTCRSASESILDPLTWMAIEELHPPRNKDQIDIH